MSIRDEVIVKQQEEIEFLKLENQTLERKINAYKNLTEAGDKIRNHQSKLLSEAKTVESEREANAILTEQVEKLQSQLEAGALRGKELVRAINLVLQGELNPTNILQQALKRYNS